MQKRQDLQSVSGEPERVEPDAIDQIADLIESNLNDVAGAADGFYEVVSHAESTHLDDLDD